MTEKLFLLLVLVFFILAFAIKNIKTYFAAGQSIKGKSPKLTASILLSTLIYLIIILRIILADSQWLMEMDLSGFLTFKLTGYAFISLGFIMGILALITMKNSWRVGIKYDQKTHLITNGIYRFSRNPYFFSYDLLILGYILVFPSLVLLLLYIPLTIVFHFMILEEEQYLESVHGTDYLEYKRKVRRYI